MTQITTDQQRMETAAWSVSTKLQVFQEGLTADEQQVLDMAFRRISARVEESTEDAGGYLLAGGAAFGPLAGVVAVQRFLEQLARTPPQQPAQTPPRQQ